jgi:anthranilate/para-aminobenzoate synthase component I
VETADLPWEDPLEFVTAVAGLNCYVFYHSADLRQDARYSLFACNPKKTLIGSEEDLALRLSSDRQLLDNAWFGFMGYEYGRPETQHLKPSTVPLPTVWFSTFHTVYCWDHAAKNLTRHGSELAFSPASSPSYNNPSVVFLQSNMSRQTYLEKVQKTIEQIHAGEFYQANITRKFYGEFDKSPCPVQLFKELCQHSPGRYSAIIKLNHKQSILSSSPEKFLTIRPDGHITTQPIKGTARRANQDRNEAEALQKDEKNRAENLMIVDLMRHDLSLSCKPGSIVVTGLHEVNTHATLHHMHSTISGELRDDISPLSAIRNAFPPGSMTGAPKKHAIDWCQQMEAQQRGVYSGALGWFGGDGSVDLSVVIRTLCLDETRFEFQVGGGIVADSIPEHEWQETLTKALGIAKTLRIDPARLESL